MPTTTPTKATIDELPEETVLYEAHPAMFRNQPIGFILAVLLVPFIIGAVILFVWWLSCKYNTLIVTNKRVLHRTGILSRNVSDIKNRDVRNIQVRQSFFQRLMGVGSIGISSAGQAGVEIEVAGLPHPDLIRQYINEYR